MAGPTPVSALIHAATMVTAGVYMVARMHAVYLLSPAAHGHRRHRRRADRAVRGRSSASPRTTSRRCSPTRRSASSASCSSGVGTGNFDGGIFHLFTHAFFKAGLFLCAGSVMHAMSGSGDITKHGRPAQEAALDARRVLRLLAGDLRRPDLLRLLLARTRSSRAPSRPRSTAASLAWVGTVGRACCWCWRRWARRSTCRASTSWSSPAPCRADERPSTTSTSRPSSWSARWWCWPSARCWAASSAFPGGALRPPRAGTCSARVAASRCWARELEVAAQHRDRLSWSASTAAGAGRHRARLRLLRRRLPRAGARVRARSSPASSRWCGTSSASTSSTALIIIRPLQALCAVVSSGRRPHPHRQDPGRRLGVRGRPGRPHRALLPGRRRAALHGGVRHRRRGAGLLRHAPDRARRAQGRRSRATPSRSTRADAEAAAAATLEYSFDFDGDGTPERDRRDPVRARAPTAAPARYTDPRRRSRTRAGAPSGPSSGRSRCADGPCSAWITLLPLVRRRPGDAGAARGGVDPPRPRPR